MSFPDNRVIILPQTAYYRNDDEYLKLGAQIYRAHPDLYFCARDKLTFELIKNNDFMESQRLLYMPDMALYSTLWKRKGDIEKHVDNQIGLCLRDDRELVMSDSMREKIIAEVRRFDPDYTEIRTNESDRSIRVNQREENILRKLREISNLKLLVTDRLHAMIMAAITDTPCIAFDNSTHKVKGTYDWIKELDYIRFLNSPDNITEIIEQMIDCSIYHMRFDMWDKTEYLRRISEWF